MSTSEKKQTSGIVFLDDLDKDHPFEFLKDEDDERELEEAVAHKTAGSSLNNEIVSLEETPKAGEGVTTLIDSEKQTLEPELRVETNVYRDQLKKLFGEKVSTIVHEVEGQQVSIPIDELDIDEELYTKIIHGLIDHEREEAGRDKISVKGISDFMKNLIEIDQKGGDTSDLVKIRTAYLDPLDKLDMETTDGQKQAIALKATAQGRTQEEVEALLNLYESKGILEEKGAEAEKWIREATLAEAEKKKKEAADLEIAQNQAFKDYKKSFKTTLSETFQLKEAVINKLVDIATKKGDDKQYEMDKALKEARLDPARAARLALWLSDEEEYNLQISNKKLTESKLQSGINIGTIKDKSQNSTVGGPASNTGGQSNFVALED